MHTFKSFAIGVTMMVAIATTATHASFEQRVNDGSLSLTYKTYRWDQETKNAPRAYEKTQDEFVHALIADYHSGYFADTIGFDVQAGMALNINSDKNLESTNLSGGDKDSLENIADIQQAYLKSTFGDDNLNIYSTYGQKKRNLQSYKDSDDRILNASSFGTEINGNIHGLNLYVNRIDAFSARNQSTTSHLKNSKAKTIDDLIIVGVGYEWQGIGGVIEQANANNYLRKAIAKVYYTWPINDCVSIDFDARHGKVEKSGDLYDTAFVQNGKYDSSYNNINTTLNVGNAYIGVGHNKTKGGDYDDKLFNQDNGRFNSSLDLEMGYNYEDETAYVVKAGYDFADYVPGLSINAWYAKGENAKNFDSFNQKEVGGNISYNFSDVLDGLSLKYFHTAYQASGNTQIAGRDDALNGLYNTHINRLYLTYTVAIF